VGSGATYTPVGVLWYNSNQSNGFGTVFVTINGLQNGARLMYALVDVHKTIQF
jgi:hypothetical protein